MKVLLTTDWYTSSVNGVVTSVCNLANGLKDLGCEVKILTLSDNLKSYKEGDVYYMASIPAGAIYPGARATMPLKSSPLVSELIEWEPDIIHSNCEFSTFMLAFRIKKELGVPLVHTYHTIYEDYTHYLAPAKKISKAIERRAGDLTVIRLSKKIGEKITKKVGTKVAKQISVSVSERTDATIAPTEKTKSVLESYGITVPIPVIPTGIDLSAYDKSLSDEEKAELRKGLGIPEDHAILACIGRLAEEKNVQELICMMPKLSGHKVTLMIVGGGPYKKNLEALAEKLELKNVVFTGMVPPDDVWKYYHLGDLFVSASTSETQGLTYIEALSSKLPLLCKKDDALTDVIIEGCNGWQYRNQEDFINALEVYLSSRSLKHFIPINAGISSEKFSVPNFAESVLKTYEQLIAEYKDTTQ